MLGVIWNPIVPESKMLESENRYLKASFNLFLDFVSFLGL